MSKLSLWTIYDHPLDFPNHFVARCFILDQPTGSYMQAGTLEQLRDVLLVEMGLSCITRDESDDPKIVETWL